MAARPPDAEDPGTDTPREDEAQWLDIVARLAELDAIDADAAGPRAPGTTPEPDRRAAEPGTDRTAGPGARSVGPALPASDPRSWTVDPAVEEAEDHFEPPDPGPVLDGDPLLTMAWTAVAGVPLLLMVVAVVWREVPTIVLQTAGVVFLAGLGLLLWRMPHGHADDDDRGPGAVV